MRLFGRRKFEREMDAELRFHVETYVDDLVRSGIARPEAERRARVAFGPIAATKDECRQAWGWQWLDDVHADLRLTFRILRHNLGFTTVAVLSLALGIGATTAIFGLVDAVVLRGLPVRDPAHLVFVRAAGTDGPNGGPPYPCFELFRDHASSFEALAAFSHSNMDLIVDGNREQARGLWVSGNFYELLGVRPIAGRTLSANDDGTIGSGGPAGPVAVISEPFWRHRFGGDRNVIGRQIRIFDHTATIVGVMPANAISPEPGRPVDLAVPITLSDPGSMRDRGSWWLDVVGRLKPGTTRQQATAETDAIFQAFMADSTLSPAVRKVAFDHIELAAAGQGVGDIRRRYANPLTALMILAGLVLIAACVNVANLMFARATSREREFALRVAIGAGHGRLVRQTLTEATVLVGAGALLGVALAVQGERALAAFFAGGSRPIVLSLSVNARLLLFTLSVSVLTGLAFGLVPALRAARVDPARGLRGTRTVAGSRRARTVGRILMVLQLAVSIVLLVTAGLFMRSLHLLESVDLGFKRDGVLVMEVTPERTWFGQPQWLALQGRLLERVRAVPGVQSVSWSTMSPLSGRDRGSSLQVPGFVPEGPRGSEIHVVSASPQYFETFGIALTAGRAITDQDDLDAPKVAVIGETAARFFFGGASPLGKRVGFSRTGDPDYEIVGVVNDVRHHSVRGNPWRFIYLPIPQSIDRGRMSRLVLAARVSGDTDPISRQVQATVRDAGPSLLLTNVSTMERQVEQSLMTERLVSVLSVAFGALSLVLVSVGLYGVLAYAVASRTNELGIRMALGATRQGVVWLVLREAAVLAGAGIAVGVPVALALGRLTKALLYGVAPLDLLSLSAAVTLVLLVAAAAGAIPARRASRLSPVTALRSE
ncbi:MAG: ABC transporter permease [Vicinamibacterales bacterium]